MSVRENIFPASVGLLCKPPFTWPPFSNLYREWSIGLGSMGYGSVSMGIEVLEWVPGVGGKGL